MDREYLINISLAVSDGNSGVYFFYFNGTPFVYIGATKNRISRRINQHIAYMRRGKHANKFVQDLYKKHGASNLKWGILEITNNLKERENFYLENISKNILINKLVNVSLDSSFTSLSREVVLGIKKDLVEGLLIKDIAKKYGIKTNRVSKIKKGETYKTIGPVLDRKKMPIKGTTKNKILSIREDLAKGLKHKEIEKKYNISETKLTSIKYGSSGYKNLIEDNLVFLKPKRQDVKTICKEIRLLQEKNKTQKEICEALNLTHSRLKQIITTYRKRFPEHSPFTQEEIILRDNLLNRSIAEEYIFGKGTKSLAKKYNLSEVKIRRILRFYKKLAPLEKEYSIDDISESEQLRLLHSVNK